MDEVREKKTRVYWMITLVIGFLLTATAYLIVSQGLFHSHSETIEITNVEKHVEFFWHATAPHIYIEGIYQRIYYHEFDYFIDITNSKSDDATNLRLTMELKVNGITKQYQTRNVGTLKSGQSCRFLFSTMVAHIYLEAVTVITLILDNTALDQIIVK